MAPRATVAAVIPVFNVERVIRPELQSSMEVVLPDPDSACEG
jgi:hypothetical protein